MQHYPEEIKICIVLEPLAKNIKTEKRTHKKRLNVIDVEEEGRHTEKKKRNEIRPNREKTPARSVSSFFTVTVYSKIWAR